MSDSKHQLSHTVELLLILKLAFILKLILKLEMDKLRSETKKAPLHYNISSITITYPQSLNVRMSGRLSALFTHQASENFSSCHVDEFLRIAGSAVAENNGKYSAIKNINIRTQ